MAGRELIDACYMWCLTTGRKPRRLDKAVEEFDLYAKAVEDFKGSFKDLNENQRCLIAGIGLED